MANEFGNKFVTVYPAIPEITNKISGTSIAEDVFVGYKFCGNLQKFLLDYSFKINSEIPLSDEVTQDGFSNE